jgi:uncharacterized protein YbjQ (UPF0145 family)
MEMTLVAEERVPESNREVLVLEEFEGLRCREIEAYTKLMAESHEPSLDRMRVEAESLGANAIVEVRFSTSMNMQAAAEILVYRTAVVVEPER